MAKPEHGSVEPLKTALYMLERHGGKLTPAIARTITESVQSALDILRRGDPLTERLAFIALAMRQSTAIKVFKHGKDQEIEYVEILDQDLHRIAMKMLHTLP